MKKICISVLMLFISFGAIFAKTVKEDKVKINNDVDLYELPDSKSTVIDTLIKGTEVEILENTDSKWTEIKINSEIGFINTSSINLPETNIKSGIAKVFWWIGSVLMNIIVFIVVLIILSKLDMVFSKKITFTVVSFALFIGCIIGYYLFKNIFAGVLGELLFFIPCVSLFLPISFYVASFGPFFSVLGFFFTYKYTSEFNISFLYFIGAILGETVGIGISKIFSLIMESKGKYLY